MPPPQIPLTGNIGPQGNFPLLNSINIVIGDSDYTMAYPDMSASILRITSSATLTDARSIIAPLTFGFEFAVQNMTTGNQALIFRGATGDGVVIPHSQSVFLFCDGNNYVTASSSTPMLLTTGTLPLPVPAGITAFDKTRIVSIGEGSTPSIPGRMTLAGDSADNSNYVPYLDIYGPGGQKAIFGVPVQAGTIDAQTYLQNGQPFAGGGASSNLVAATASSLGCVLDCDLATGAKVGGGVATDNTAIINAFFAGASINSPRRLIIDGGSAITGIKIPATGNCSIVGEGWSTGFFVKTGSFASAILVGPEVDGDPGPPAPPIAGYAVAFSDFMINGNRGDGTNGNSTSGNPRGGRDDPANGYPWLYGMDISSVIHLEINHVRFYECPTYNIRLNNCVNTVITTCRFDNPNMQWNTDNIHVNGSNGDIRISKCWFQAGDDAIAINSPEGFSGGIDRVTVSDCIFHDVLTCMRFFSAHSSLPRYNRIMNVVVTNCVAPKINSIAFWIAAEGQITPLPDAIRELHVSNFVATGGGGFMAISDNIGTLKVNNCTLINPNNNTGFFYSPYSGSYVVSACDVSRCSIYKDREQNNFFLTSALSLRFKQLRVDGFAYDFPSTMTLAPMSAMFSTANVDNLIIDAVDVTNIASFGAVNSISIAGAGLTGTSWSFPDSRMANGTIYVSANQNDQLVAKVANSVHLLTGERGTVVVPPPQQHDPTDFWVMQEGAGTELANAYNPTNVLTASGGVLWQNIPANPGVSTLVFDGTGICTAAFSTSTSFDGTTPFTITVWVLPTTLTAGTNYSIIGTLDTVNNNRGFYLVLYGPETQFYLVSNLATNDYLQVNAQGAPANVINANATHIAVTYDGSRLASGVQIYVRGSSVTTGVERNTLTGNSATFIPATVGSLPDLTSGFIGGIFNLGIWNRVLSPSEIAALAGIPQ